MKDNKTDNEDIVKDIGTGTVCYTVERKFLALISAEELVSRIIRSHIKNENGKGVCNE